MTIASVNQFSSVREIPWSDLLKQTFHTLADRLGGPGALLSAGRPVFRQE